jgi:hypothetical protein
LNVADIGACASYTALAARILSGAAPLGPDDGFTQAGDGFSPDRRSITAST